MGVNGVDVNADLGKRLEDRVDVVARDGLEDASGAEEGAEGGREARGGHAEHDEVLVEARVLHHVHVKLQGHPIERTCLADDEEDVEQKGG